MSGNLYSEVGPKSENPYSEVGPRPRQPLPQINSQTPKLNRFITGTQTQTLMTNKEFNNATRAKRESRQSSGKLMQSNAKTIAQQIKQAQQNADNFEKQNKRAGNSSVANPMYDFSKQGVIKTGSEYNSSKNPISAIPAYGETSGKGYDPYSYINTPNT